MNDKMRIRIMFWNPSVHGTNNNDSESVKYINMLGTAMENENKEEFRSIVSSLTEWSYDRNPHDLVVVLQYMQAHVTAMTESMKMDTLPFLFHCIDMEDEDLLSISLSILRSFILGQHSILCLNSIYNSLHTFFSTNEFSSYSLTSLLPLLYHQYSKIDISTQGLPSHHIIVNSACVELRSLYFHLCENRRLLVRREAARNLGTCMKVFGSSSYSRCLSQLQDFLHDDDSVHLAVLPFLPVFFKECPNDTGRNQILSFYSQSLQSKAYHIQEEALKGLQKMGEVTSIHSFCLFILDVVIRLLRDTHSPVRASAFTHLSWLYTYLPSSLFHEQVWPIIPSMIKENQLFISENIIPVIIDMLDTEREVAEPLLQSLLQQDNDVIREYCLIHYTELGSSQGMIDSLLTQQDVGQFSWRTRQRVAQCMPVLLSHSSSSSLLSIYLKLFDDPVHSVRVACRQSVCGVCSCLSCEECLHSLIPRLYSLYGESTYHTQSNLLYVFGMLMTSELLKDNQDDLIPMKEIVIGELSNPVPNMRFIACKVLQSSLECYPDTMKKEYIIPKLEELRRDNDKDVQEFSTTVYISATKDQHYAFC